MKSLKLILGALVVSAVLASSAFAQSAYRADEMSKDPSSFRVGDSEDLQGDQRRADELRVCENMKERAESTQREQFKNFIKDKHFGRGSDYI